MLLAVRSYKYSRLKITLTDMQIIFKELPNVRRSSWQSSVGGATSSSVLLKQCIFCIEEKYQKCSETREKLTTCMQFRADKKICEIVEQRNDSELLAITSDELIAKEVHYHASCYRTYTKLYQKKSPDTEGESEHSKVWELLIDLFENPKVEEFKNIQSLCKSNSQNKNLKRKTESQTDMFQFLKVGKELLIYPSSLKIDDS